jgi:hypothetical protein
MQLSVKKEDPTANYVKTFIITNGVEMKLDGQTPAVKESEEMVEKRGANYER